ncbi:MAG: NUDIX domain-containing protein [Angustibacter sp.]
MTELELADVLGERPVRSREERYRGSFWSIRRDRVDLGPAGEVTREVLDHPGAVAVLALDENDRVPLVLQYRHPARMRMWELPAGLLDVPEESPVLAAQRELAEEADLLAESWHTLLDWQLTPGGSTEAMRCFVARGLSEVPAEQRHRRTEEEADMPVRWFPLDEIRDAILAGRLHNPSVVTGVLAACAARASGWSTLRAATAPWPEHPRGYGAGD